MTTAIRKSERGELLDRLDGLFSAVVSDILDQLGHRDQVMAARLRPLYPEARVVGYARTVLATPSAEIPDRKEDRYKMELAAIESLTDGEVMVVSTIEHCFWGELLSIAARRRGARGIVIDGYTRDVSGITDLRFPTFVTGIHAADALGRVNVVEFGGEILSGGVQVRHGDLVIGDFDGVTVIPAEIAEEVISLAEEKVSGEDIVRVKLEEGMSVSEAFHRYGVL